MRRAAIDADIFFFSISHKSESLTKRDINPYDIKKFLFHPVVSKFLILHTQCSKEVKQILLNSMILAQKGYLLLVNYVGIGFSL